MTRSRLLPTVLLATGLAGCFGDAWMTATPWAVSTEFDPSCGAACDQPWGGGRLLRLTHAQWENTTTDLLQLSTPSQLSAGFTGDTTGGLFDTHSGGLKIGQTLWGDYQNAAEQLAVRLTLSSTALAPLLPASLPASGEARTRAFIANVGSLTHRRPLSAQELEEYLVLFARGLDLTALTDPFLAGARIVLQAMLQSPHFLYRVEESAPGTDGRIRLS